MRTFRLDKLVRDKIPLDMEARGQEVSLRTLDTAAYYHETGRKVLEETVEFDPHTTKEAMLKELADRKEAERAARKAREALTAELGLTEIEVEAMRLRCLDERGGFETRTFVEVVTLQDNDSLVDYYASEPDRFKEITE